MSEYERTITLLESMRDRANVGGFSSSDKATIVNLYSDVCGKTVRNTGCQDCYKDAYIEIYLTLKRNGTMPKTSNYVLKPGVVIHKFGTNDFYALTNCPDKVAEDWLKEDKQRINLFSKFPGDWEERITKPATHEDDGGENGTNDGAPVEAKATEEQSGHEEASREPKDNTESTSEEVDAAAAESNEESATPKRGRRSTKK